MRTIFVNNNPINIHDESSIGMSLSGGADSALLLYILMSNTTQHIHIYSMFSDVRRPAMESHVDAIVETCARLTGHTNFTYRKEPVHKQSPEMLFDLLTSKFDSKEIDIAYVGLTKFPPYNVWKDFPDQQPEWHNKFRTDETVRPLYGISIPIEKDTDIRYLTKDMQPTNKKAISIDNRAYVPFVNLNKKDIAGMYKFLGIEKDLFVKTRSCETPSHFPGHCGKCWWCHERMWAFNYLE